ncbi:DNA-binding transcriptional regulator, AcrR family [Amycolatopsis pretoriensis]|uniref:DNA-binding transcriptional regulator, AcrR family n=1 Tax=Amycolatopsis pretoriensis TaxID=218821 RepID=A0A1H5RIQ9_9PSEU|nr:TetR family transcriptional regulator [Amycolatopsis pretoriensis]SEF38219.1 DNA-binding transcriptional regulator, AcrR family [Amycolatopsis pretoriensis]
MPPTRRRARSDQDKEVRKTALLTAARELAADRGVREVTLTEVTNRVGLHPSALRRYFESREELLLELAEQGWPEWRERLIGDLGGRRLTALEIADVVAGSLDALPLFCDLQTHVGLSLEGAVRLERARRYKTAASESFDAMTAALADAGEGLDAEGARTILTAAMSCAAYLFQLSRPSPTLRRLYDEVPRWAHSALRFREQLTTLLRAVAVGVTRQP